MPMGSIPLPGMSNEPFKDVMDYFEQIQQRKAQQQQFGQQLDLDKQKLAQSGKFDALKQQLLLAKIAAANRSGTNAGKTLSAQERSSAMKLLDAGRALQGMRNKSLKLKQLLKENPNLTGLGGGLKTLFGVPGESLGTFNETAGNLQADFGKLASRYGGAQVLKWAGKVKPGEWKDVDSNLGYVNSIYDNAGSDFEDIKNQYEDITGKPYPLQLPKAEGNNPPGTTIMYKGGEEYHIPNDKVESAKKSGYKE